MLNVAKLPVERETKNHLHQLKLGESGWVVPWAMSVDRNRHCYLNEDYPFHPTRFGTANMLVKRDTLGRYSVDLRYTDHTWDCRDRVDDSSWFSIPIMEIQT